MGFLTHDEKRRNRDFNNNQIGGFNKNADEVIQRLMAQHEGKYDQIRKRFSELVELRESIIRAPATKKEYIEVAKRRIRAGKSSFIQNVIKPQVLECYNLNHYPPDSFSLGLDSNARYLIAAMLDEETIEAMINSFPDVPNCMTAADKEKRIEEINAEIADLQLTIEAELKNVCGETPE